jgi:hypothetical protein
MAYPCLICGADLVELEEETPARCAFCAQEQPVLYLCPLGHAVCDDCQAAEPPDVILRVCSSTRETDPVAIANLVMRHPAFTMHGPYHHQLVAPVALTALANLGLAEFRPDRLKPVMRRTADIPLGTCGIRGACGAAEGVGVVLSVLTGASYLKDVERSLAMRGTAEALLAMAAAGGPRCCKESIYLSLETLSRILHSTLGLDLPVQGRCDFAALNAECRQARCAYYVSKLPEV